MVPVMPVITVMSLEKPISKETAGSQQPGSQLKLVQVLLSVLEEQVGLCCCRALICCVGDGSLCLAGVWSPRNQLRGPNQLWVPAGHNSSPWLQRGGRTNGSWKKEKGPWYVHKSLMLVLPWEDVLHLICFCKFLHICLFSKTNQWS